MKPERKPAARRLSLVGASTLAALLLLSSAPALARADGDGVLRYDIEQFDCNERTGLARAYIDLAEEGFPGPDISDFPQDVLVGALAMLDKVPAADRAAGHDELVLRGCLLLARQQRVQEIIPESPVAGGVGAADLLLSRGRCLAAASAVPRTEPAWCAAAGILAAAGPLPSADSRQVSSRCQPPDAAAILADLALRAGELDRINLLLPDVEGSWFQRQYGNSLGTAAREARRHARLLGKCEGQGDCTACRAVARRLFVEGREEAGLAAVARLVHMTPAPCLREAATLLSWRQDWESLDQLVPGGTDASWWQQLRLYRRLTHLASSPGDGSDDGELSVLMAAACGDQGGCALLGTAARGLVLSARVYAGAMPAEKMVEWVLALSAQPDILSAGAPALAALLTLLAPVGTDADADLVLDRFLAHPANSGECSIAHMASVELLVTAIRNRDVVRLQQARVMLDRGLLSCAKDIPRQVHLEYLAIIAGFSDARCAGEIERGLFDLKNRLERLLAQKGGLMEPELRGQASLNYLAALVRVRNPTGIEIDSRLHEAVERDVPFHLLWVQRLLGERRIEQALAVARMCESVAQSDAELSACLAWQAALQRYWGHEELSRGLLDRALACFEPRDGPEEKAGVSCLLSGERRLRIALDRKGELRVETGFSPRFLVILLPQAGLPISPLSDDFAPPESTPSGCVVPKP